MKVLLISLRDELGEKVSPLPLGLACVAGATKEAGYDMRLVSLLTMDYGGFQLRNVIVRFHPDVIGISVRNIDDQDMQDSHFFLAPLRELVATCRRVSGASVVVGGAGYSIFPQAALSYLQADMGVKGEGERAFPALLNWIERGAQGTPPAGTHLHNRASTSTAFVPNLDSFPLPEPDIWLHNPHGEAERIPVQSRRGCPLNCIYCSTSAIEGKPVRKRSPESIVSWLAKLCERGFRSLYFVDNTFNLPPSYAKEFCRQVIQAELGLDWWSIVYPKWVDKELVELMAEAGCTQVSLGFESGSEAMLERLNKRFSCSEVKAISGLFSAAGIKRNGFLLLGGPGETRETVEESLAFANSLHFDALKITVGLRIYPGTSLHSIALAEGVVTPEDDLLRPKFYLSRSLREWLPQRIAVHRSRTSGFP